MRSNRYVWSMWRWDVLAEVVQNGPISMPTLRARLQEHGWKTKCTEAVMNVLETDGLVEKVGPLSKRRVVATRKGRDADRQRRVAEILEVVA